MANTLYDNARKMMLEGDLDWANDTIKVQLVKSGEYSFDATHVSMDDMAGPAKVGDAETMNTSVTGNGAADADNVTFPQVASGHQISALVIYKDLGTNNEVDKLLLVWIDTSTGLPITSNGGDIIVTWDSGTNRIFRP